MKIIFKLTINLILLAVLSAIAVFVFNTFSENISFGDSAFNFYRGKKKAALSPGAPLTQVITAKKNNLSQIKIAFRNMPITEGEEISVQLNDESCNNILTEDSINHLIEPRTFYNFNFDPIPDSKDKKYCLKILYLSNVIAKEDTPYVLASHAPNFKGHSYRNEGKQRTYQDRSLAIRPSYSEKSFGDTVTELNKRISQYKPGFLKGSYLNIIAFSFIALSILVAVLLIML